MKKNMSKTHKKMKFHHCLLRPYRGMKHFYRGEKGILKKHKQDPEKKGLEKKQGGKNKDITPGWSPKDTHVSPKDTHGSPQDTHGSPQDTHGSPQGTHGSPQGTHGSLPDTHVSPPDTPPGAKSQKTQRK